MTGETKTRLAVMALVYMMVNAVLFGAGMLLFLNGESIGPHDQASAGIWSVVAASFILAAPIAWWLTPRLRARQGRRGVSERDRIEADGKR
ncbi:hypothetical protein KKP04_03885 [Rhodomicrobium sp. Az07]|uniref:hypothetical protein n=1 Tax=Rhodomicrobium sp. Az07 TaxID=2839034 RepID=UPI001BE6D8E8|nr:hypothetical protein [Rhodomicrobium sp. Az07]MBT3070009.1 hypothetical protein [Rhodomicrobium sp. Az07]